MKTKERVWGAFLRPLYSSELFIVVNKNIPNKNHGKSNEHDRGQSFHALHLKATAPPQETMRSEKMLDQGWMAAASVEVLEQKENYRAFCKCKSMHCNVMILRLLYNCLHKWLAATTKYVPDLRRTPMKVSVEGVVGVLML